MKQTQSITKKHKHKGIMEEMEMAKKTVQVVPEIIDSVEGLNAKMAAMREAQKVFATYTQEQLIRSSSQQQAQQIKCVSRWQRWQ